MAHRSLTGALLVGGRSERFGSPKALATHGGVTLLERGRAVLEAACDEVLVVGKAGAEWLSGIEVVDDGTAETAPVYGVVAALRAARNEICVVVPVDCVSITPEAVRALGEQRAVAPTGPLPGAYARELLPILEERIARGLLSLRGVNPTVLAWAPDVFADVDTPEDLAALDG